LVLDAYAGFIFALIDKALDVTQEEIAELLGQCGDRKPFLLAVRPAESRRPAPKLLPGNSSNQLSVNPDSVT